MVEQMLGNAIISKARESGYEIRITNSWSAYEWLSEETEQAITSAMQNMQIEEKVNDLLRIALLMEHGGVIMKVSEVLPI